MDEFQTELSDREKKIRRRFAQGYVLYLDPLKAVFMLGYNDGAAREYAVTFMQEAYTLAAIHSEEELLLKEAGERKLTPWQLRIERMLLSEASNKDERSSHSARVAALGKLATINRMDAPVKVESNINHSGNLSHSFDFSTLKKHELELVRKLLESRASDGMEPAVT